MNEKTLMLAAGTLLMVVGYAVYLHARRRFRTVGAPGIGPKIHPGQWRTRREWFSSDRGYRMSRRGAWMMSLGGLIALIGSFL